MVVNGPHCRSQGSQLAPSLQLAWSHDPLYFGVLMSLNQLCSCGLSLDDSQSCLQQ